MIAYALSGQPVNNAKLSVESLERCGACVFLDQSSGIISVPTAVLILLAHGVDAHDNIMSASDQSGRLSRG